MNLTKHYTIKPAFAKANGLPTAINAVKLRETPRAAYLYGHGLVPADGSCARCGRNLTHPGSILIGIGPECLNNWGLRDVVLDNLTDAQAAELRGRVRSRGVDQWVPKSCLNEVGPSDEPLAVPADHPIKRAANRTKAGKSAVEAGPVIRMTFPFNRNDLDFVRGLPGRRFNPDDKSWTTPLSNEVIQLLVDAGWNVAPSLLNRLTRAQQIVRDNTQKAAAVPGLKGTLFPFQQAGVAFIESKGGRALVGDEMGLGKTVQALAWLQLHPEHRPAIIVVPASLKLNWAREAETWMTHPAVQVIDGRAPVTFTGELIIINYDILTDHVDALIAYGPRALVLDECHFIKNNKTQRTKATKKLAKHAPYLIALSGTPALNRPVELFNALKLINPAVIPNFWNYVHRYCGAKHTGFGWDFTGSSNQAELHQLLQAVMIRRLKAEVLTDLPEKLYSFVPMELANAAEYARAEQNFISWVREHKGLEAAERASQAEQLVQVEALKQLAVAGKLNKTIEWIRDQLETREKLVVFAVHKTVIDALMKAFGKVAVKVDGSVSSADRDKAVQAFQHDDSVKLFVGNIRAAGVGLTLTASSAVAFVELPWSPGELVQAEDRCHRIGQRNAVNIYYLVAPNTIEEQIAHLLDSKRTVLNAILDGQAPEEASLLTSLMDDYLK